MKRLFLLIFSLYLSLSSSAQRLRHIPARELKLYNAGQNYNYARISLNLDKIINSPDSMTEKGELALEINEHLLNESLQSYQQLLTKYPHSKLHLRAQERVASLLYEMHNVSAAKMTYLDLLNSKDGRHALPYKYDASIMLAQICMDEDRYYDALVYLHTCPSGQGRMMCGNAAAEDDVKMKVMYIRCYLKTNNEDSALIVSMPYLQDRFLIYNQPILDYAVPLLLKKYTKQELLQKLEVSYKGYKVEISGKRQNTRVFYSVEFLGEKASVMPELSEPYMMMSSEQISKITKEEADKFMMEKCTSSNLYKMLRK